MSCDLRAYFNLLRATSAILHQSVFLILLWEERSRGGSSPRFRATALDEESVSTFFGHK